MTSISLFGPIHEKNVVFLVDTSGTMYFCLRSVQDNLVETLLELAEKPDAHFNVIEYNNYVTAWANECVVCNEQTVAAASRWIRSRETSTGNNLLEAIRMAFEDQKCHAIYVVTNSLPSERKSDVIDEALFAANGRPINCIYLASTLSDPAAEELLHDLAWETKGSLKVLEVSESGRFQRANVIFDGEQRHIRSTSGKVYSRDKYCSLTKNPFFSPPAGMVPHDLGLPWESRYNPVWWNSEFSAPINTSHIDEVPLTRYHAARALLKEGDVYDAVLGAPSALPGAGMLLVDKKVLARRIEDGYYYLGRVKSEVSRDRFLVQFDELNKGKYRNTTYQEVWIYDIISFVDAFRHPIIPGDKVLVPVESGKYAPAVVLQGHEQRSDPTSGIDRSLVVNHLDGRSETLDYGVAIWIPAKLHERVSFELRLPSAARKSLESHIGYPKAPYFHELKPTEKDYVSEEEYIIEDEPDNVEYEEVLLDENPPHGQVNSLQEYYDKLYPEWPWWWKWWYQQYPLKKPARRPPRVIRRTKIVHSPEHGVHRHHRRSSSYDKYERERDRAYDEEFQFEDSGVADSYFRRIREQEELDQLMPDEVVEIRRHHLKDRRALSPARISFADEAGTQTLANDFRRAKYYMRRDKEQQPWRYWRNEEPPSQLGESTYAANIRASSSPSRRRDDLDERLRRAERRRDEQHWWEKEQQRSRTAADIPSDVEYVKLVTYERPHIRSAVDPKPTKVYTDYVAQDRGVAEWNDRTEPKPRRRHAHEVRRVSHESPSRNERRHYSDKYPGRESVYYDAEYVHQIREEYPPAGLPLLYKYVTRDETRSRRANHLQRVAADEERERRHTERKERAVDARASYNASVNAWFTNKEERNFEHEREKAAALQRKRAEVDARHKPHVSEVIQMTTTERVSEQSQRQSERPSGEANNGAPTDANNSAPK